MARSEIIAQTKVWQATNFVWPKHHRKPRILGLFPAKVRGVDVAGRPFELEITLDNLSIGGLYVRINRRVRLAAKLLFVFRIPGPDPNSPGLRIAAHGSVRRVEPLPDGGCGIGVEFERYRCL